MSTDIVKTRKQGRRGSGIGGIEYYTLRDVKRVLLGRKWMISTITLVTGVLVAGFAYKLPNQYKASALIMVDPGKVPETYVKSTATIDATRRLAILQEQILSDTRLGQVIEELNLFRSLNKTKSQGEIVDLMRNKIEVETTTSGAPARALKTFSVSFTAQSPVIAAKVASRLASLFIEENLKVREQQVVGTADFFEGQLQKAKQDLDQKSQKLAQLRARYATDLPESQNLHLQALTSAQLALREESDAANRARQQKTYLEALLSSAPKVIDLDRTGSTAATGLQTQLEKLQGEMEQLLTHYGPGYPDVRAKDAEIQNLKQKIKELGTRAAPTAQADNASHNPAIEGQIATTEEEIRKHEARQTELASQIKFHEDAIQRVPAAQEELTSANNDVAAASDRYKRLEDRKFGADMFSDVEARQQGERFVLVDPAQPPDHASWPNRLMIDGIGVGAGLGIAVIIVALLEIVPPTVKTEREFRERLGVPTFGEIPILATPSDSRRNRLWAAFMLTANLLLAVGYAGVLAISLNR